MSEQNLEFLGYRGKSNMPWNQQPAEASRPDKAARPDVKEIHERFDNAMPPPVEAAESMRSSPVSRLPVEGKAQAPKDQMNADIEEESKCDSPMMDRMAGKQVLSSIRGNMLSKALQPFDASRMKPQAGMRKAEGMDPESPEANDQLRQELEERKPVEGHEPESGRPQERCLTSPTKRLLQRIKTALKTRVFGSDLEHYVKGTRTNGEAMQALEKLANKLVGQSDLGTLNPGKVDGLTNETDPDKFYPESGSDDVNTRGQGAPDSNSYSRGSMLSPHMSQFDAGRNAKQCNGGGNLNFKKGK